MYEPAKISDTVQAQVDEEISKFITAAEQVAEKLMKKHEKTIHKMVEKLLEVETLDAEEFIEIVGAPKARPKLV
jgi:ATP-dependent Zn protease